MTGEEEISILKDKIDKLSNDNHVLKTAFIMQRDEIIKLNELVAKLKSCKNCVNYGGDHYCIKRRLIMYRLQGGCEYWGLKNDIETESTDK